MPEAQTAQYSSWTPESHREALDFIEEVTADASNVQRRVLSEILAQNSMCEYLQRHGLAARTDAASFKRLLPVISYDDLQPDIHRIALGDTSPILCCRPISEFLTSSGTSGGERKLMPTIEDELERRTRLYSLLMPVMNQYVPGLDKGKGMYFLFVKSEAWTPGGLIARPVLTSYYKSRHFVHRPHDPFTVYTSPDEAILCSDSYQSMYAQLLCGLAQRLEVLRVGAVFASGFIRAIRFLQKHWPELCRDLRAGAVGPEITDAPLRAAVERILSGHNGELADAVERECRAGTWKGIITRVWPNTMYVDVIVTGTMAQYIPTLDHYSGGLPLTCTMYASSECYFGLNLTPICKPSEVAYTLIPTMCYYEFLPLDSPSASASASAVEPADLVDLVDVQPGREYELIVTTYAGLYRYRVGDVLRAVGFKNKAPQFRFVCRKNVALSIDADKTDEVELHRAVERAAGHLEPLGATLVEYTSYADTATIPGHYVLYWEVKAGEAAVPASVYEDCCLEAEEALGSVYRQCRVADRSIGPLEIRVVEEGTFDKLMDYAVSRGASINQYKAPRCVKYEPIVELLEARVRERYLSPKCPRWVPGHKLWTAGAAEA